MQATTMTTHATGEAGGASFLRADARRNRERILTAARDVFIDLGSDAPLEAIATRSGVGIATLYRRFPDRAALSRAVVLDVMRRVVDEARLAVAEEQDAFESLARYMHRALDLRVSAIVPALLDQVSMLDAEIVPIRDESAALLQQMIARAQDEGTLRPDVTFADIGLSLVRFARPLPGPFSRDLDNSLAHRHLDLFLAGLRSAAELPASPLRGPAMTLDDLRAMVPGE